MQGESMRRLLEACLREAQRDDEVREAAERMVQKFDRLPPDVQRGVYERELLIAFGAVRKLALLDPELATDVPDGGPTATIPEA